MFLDLVIRIKNILFVAFSTIVTVILNCVLLTSLNLKEIHLNQYRKLNFDYVATSIVPYDSDDAYFMLKEPLYYKLDDKIKLIDAKVLMEQEKSKREKFYSNLILSENKSNITNGITITESIAEIFHFNLNDKIYDINNKEYSITRIIDDIYHLFGENIEVSSLIILNYDKDKVDNTDDKYLAFCNYNNNVYSSFYLQTNNAISNTEKQILNYKIIYSCLLTMILILYLIFCNYQFRLDRAFYLFGYNKMKLLSFRLLCNLINCSIFFVAGLLALLILNINVTLFIINFVVIFMLINLMNLINILTIKTGKRIVKHA